MNVVEVTRKGRALTKSQFGCLRDVVTLNVTQGCEFGCVYCYARGYVNAPAAGTIQIYANLAQKLRTELDNPRRRSVVDRVIFNTASDSFQTHPKVLTVTFDAMKVLLERGMAISFLTKGRIPARFIDLFARYADQVTARIGLVSASKQYQKLFEPHAAPVPIRLKNIENLHAAGAAVEVRIDPIIPFYTDDEDSIHQLFTALSVRHVTSVSLSYLHLRPAIMRQLQNELPATACKVLQSCFETQPWAVVGTSSRSKLIPLPIRQKGYKRFATLAKTYNIKPQVCSCKNPEIPGQRCSMIYHDTSMHVAKHPRLKQLGLFAC